MTEVRAPNGPLRNTLAESMAIGNLPTAPNARGCRMGHESVKTRRNPPPDLRDTPIVGGNSVPAAPFLPGTETHWAGVRSNSHTNLSVEPTRAQISDDSEIIAATLGIQHWGAPILAFFALSTNMCPYIAQFRGNYAILLAPIPSGGFANIANIFRACRCMLGQALCWGDSVTHSLD